MNIKITEKLLNNSQKKLLDSLHNFSKLSPVFLDIETTGFHRKYAKISTIGTLEYTGDYKVEIFQYFADAGNDEKSLLGSFFERHLNDINSPALLITYNGNKFDIPFIFSKADSYKLNFDITEVPSIDLFEVAKSCFPGAKKLKLGDVENILNISRVDTVSGSEAAENYKEYLKTKDKSLSDAILFHNEEDVFNMIYLLKLLDFNHLHIVPKYLRQADCTVFDVRIKDYELSFKALFTNMRSFEKSILSLRKTSIPYLYEPNKNAIDLKIPLLSQKLPSGGAVSIYADPHYVWNAEYENLDAQSRALSLLMSKNPDVLLKENVYALAEKIFCL